MSFAAAASISLDQISGLVNQQKSFFMSGRTRPYEFRIQALRKLKKCISQNESLFLEALSQDLGRHDFESIISELEPLYREIDQAIRNLKVWMKPKQAYHPIFSVAHFLSRSYAKHEAFGNTLIIAPWNYPIQLAIAPLISSIAAGNTSILKPSELAVSCSQVLRKVISSEYDSEYISVVEGGVDVSQKLLEQRYDFVFFTGSPRVGKIVLSALADKLTPSVLELGGKSPVIFDIKCNLEVAVRRLLWGKFCNAGQICVAPDHLYLPRSLKDSFLEKAKSYISHAYTSNGNEYLAKIISEAHLARLEKLLEGQSIYLGGKVDRQNSKLEPTLVLEPSESSALMTDEIFGPILPILFYDSLEEVLSKIEQQEKPLALYLFSDRTDCIKLVEARTSSGYFVVNDVVVQFSHQNLPCGGVGQSGIGKYHGRYGFEAFSHLKAVEKKSSFIDFKLRYPPYKTSLNKIFRKFL